MVRSGWHPAPTSSRSTPTAEHPRRSVLGGGRVDHAGHLADDPCPRATLSRISSAGLVQTKGSGLSFQWETPVDPGFEFGDGGEAGVGQGFAAEHGEPALDEVEP